MSSPKSAHVVTGPSLCEEQYTGTLAEIHVMVRYIRREGLTIPEAILPKIARICPEAHSTALAVPEAAPIPVVPPAAAGVVAADTTPPPEPPVDLAFVLSLHGSLSKLVAPATAITIRASDTTGGRPIANWIVTFLLWATMICLVFFIVVAALQGFVDPKTDTGWFCLIAPSLMTIAAAGLGSGFYGLYTAFRYIVRSTFDPKYSQTYFVRFFLGLASGVILGYFGKNLLADGTAETAKLLAPPVLALLGGYASEAVSQILSRLAETLVTLVRGGATEAVQAKEAELKAKARQQQIELKGVLESPLRDALARVQGTTPQDEAARAALNAALAKLKE